MLCPDCNKFVSIEMADPEVSSEEVHDGQVTGSVRLVQTCADCGSELAEANLDFTIDIPDGAFPHTVSESGEDSAACGDEDISVTVEAENDDRFEGRGRYTKHFYVANLHATVKCEKCESEIELDGSTEEQASSFDSLV